MTHNGSKIQRYFDLSQRYLSLIFVCLCFTNAAVSRLYSDHTHRRPPSRETQRKSNGSRLASLERGTRRAIKEDLRAGPEKRDEDADLAFERRAEAARPSGETAEAFVSFSRPGYAPPPSLGGGAVLPPVRCHASQQPRRATFPPSVSEFGRSSLILHFGSHFLFCTFVFPFIC